MFNVELTQPQDSATLEIRHPKTQEITGATIEFAGPNSDINRDAVEALRQRRNALHRRFKKDENVPLEEVQKAYRTYLADLTLGWTGLVTGTPPAEKPLEFSRAAALAIYENNPSLYEQASLFVNDVTGFIKG